MIEITVKLFAYFRDQRFTIKTMQLHENTTVGEIVDSLNIDREEVGVLMINSRHTEFTTIPLQGDVLAVFPVVGGG